MTMEEELFDLNNFQIVPLDDDIAQSDFSNADELFPMNVSKNSAYSIFHCPSRACEDVE